VVKKRGLRRGTADAGSLSSLLKTSTTLHSSRGEHELLASGNYALVYMPYPKGIASDRERKRVRTLQLYATFGCLSFAIGLVGLVFFTAISRGSGQTSLVFTGSPKEHADYVWAWETAQGRHPGWASSEYGSSHIYVRYAELETDNSVRQLIVSVPDTRDRAVYWTPRSQSSSYPPRPVSGGILDVDRVQKCCNFMARKVCTQCYRSNI
jgi:hypothetical protein